MISSVLADEAKAFALKQPTNEDDKLSFDEIPKEQNEDLSTDELEEFGNNITGMKYITHPRYFVYVPSKCTKGLK